MNPIHMPIKLLYCMFETPVAHTIFLHFEI